MVFLLLHQSRATTCPFNYFYSISGPRKIVIISKQRNQGHQCIRSTPKMSCYNNSQTLARSHLMDRKPSSSHPIKSFVYFFLKRHILLLEKNLPVSESFQADHRFYTVLI